MDTYSQFIDFCLLAGMIHAAPNMAPRSRDWAAIGWTVMAVIVVGVKLWKGA